MFSSVFCYIPRPLAIAVHFLVDYTVSVAIGLGLAIVVTRLLFVVQVVYKSNAFRKLTCDDYH